MDRFEIETLLEILTQAYNQEGDWRVALEQGMDTLEFHLAKLDD